MGLHSSLRVDTHAAGASRNVLKRHERVRHLMTQGLWSDERSVFGLPKIKQMKMKARKAAAKEKEEAAATATPAAAPPSAS
jgi:small basic protein (TIGR04137 family)